MNPRSEGRSSRTLVALAAIVVLLLALLWLAWRPESAGLAASSTASEASSSALPVASGPDLPKAEPESEPPPAPAPSAAVEPAPPPAPAQPQVAPPEPEPDDGPEAPPFSVAGLDGYCENSHTAWVLLARVQRMRGPPGKLKGLSLSEKPVTFLQGGGSFRMERETSGAVRFEHSTRAPGPLPRADRWTRVVDEQRATLHESSSVSALTGLRARVAGVRDVLELGVRQYHLERVPRDILRPIGSSFDILPPLFDPQLFPVGGVARVPASALRGVFALPDGDRDDPDQEPFGLLEFLTTLGRDQAPLRNLCDGLRGDVQVSLSRSTATQLHLKLEVAAHTLKSTVTHDRSEREASKLPFLALESGRVDLDLEGRGELVLRPSTCCVASAQLTCLVTARFYCRLHRAEDGAAQGNVEGELRGVLYLFRCCDDCAAGSGCIAPGTTFDFYEPGSPPPGW